MWPPLAPAAGWLARWVIGSGTGDRAPAGLQPGKLSVTARQKAAVGRTCPGDARPSTFSVPERKPGVDFRILGPLEVVDAARRVPLAGTKQRALLALLVIRAPEVLTNDGLIEALWGEHPPASAAKSLQVHVSRLRTALEPSADGPPRLVVTHDRGYALAIDPAQVDSWRFEGLVAEGRDHLGSGSPARAASVLDEALSLWRGPPLSDLAYEPFAQPEVARLDELHLTALEELIDAKLALGRHAELVAEIETLVSENPYRERLRGQLMLALYRGGRQAEALQAYRDAQMILAKDLGLEPAPALKELERKILQQDPALDVAPRQPSEQVLDDASRTLQRPVLIGRDEQLRRLRAALDSAAAGRGSLCMIGGAPG